MDDAEFIVMLRNQPHVRGMIHDTSNDVDRQRQWIRDYLSRDNEYYWIGETLDGNPIGTNSLYNFNPKENRIESGRWVNLADYEGSYSFSEAVLFKDFAFKVLGVSSVVCDIVSTNTQVITFHKKLLREKELDKISFLDGIRDTKVRTIWFEETIDTWKNNRKRLMKFCGDEECRKIFLIKEKDVIEQIDYLHI